MFTAFILRLHMFLGALVLPALLTAQKAPNPNLVPNPGFEMYLGAPERWFYRGADFAQSVRYWFSATTASPDAYGPGIRVPADWSDKGFGKRKPHGGKRMVGITVYGCTDGKPHCREYIQIQLTEPLVVGQVYLFECWVSPMDHSMYVDGLGAYMSITPVRRTTDEVLVRDAQVRANTVLSPEKPEAWIRLTGQFKAKYPAEYLLIGNFSDDANTISRAPNAEAHNFAYYYIDDVKLQKIPPYLAVPVPEDDLTRQKMEKGKKFVLKDIYFEFDRSELMPRSYVELDKLLAILTRYPGMHIEVVGHTDNIGDDAYNNALSEKRARSVADFLSANKIAQGRLRVRGEGERKPIDTNDTEEGRSRNRRVEFVVLKM